MKKIYFVIAIIIMVQAGMAQPYSIGATIGDMQLAGIVNNKKATAKLRAFNDKPLVVVFWLSTCSACMGSIGKTDSLSKKYRDRVNVLMVTSEKTKEIEDVYRKKRFNGFLVPTVTGDTQMRKWFPHRSVPHFVWINRSGKVEAITDSKHFNDSTMALFAAHTPLQLPLKAEERDTRKFWSMDPIILYDYEDRKDEILSYSFFTAPREGILNNNSIQQKKNSVRITVINWSFIELYKTAYGTKFHTTQVYMADSNVAGRMKEKVCYDMILQGNSLDAAKQKMQQDLDGHLRVQSRMVMEWQKCYVLRYAKSNTPRITESREPKVYTDSSELHGFAANYPIENVLTRLPLPVVNEAGITYDHNIELPKDKTNVEIVRRYLRRYGLVLVEDQRQMVKLVIE